MSEKGILKAVRDAIGYSEDEKLEIAKLEVIRNVIYSLMSDVTESNPSKLVNEVFLNGIKTQAEICLMRNFDKL